VKGLHAAHKNLQVKGQFNVFLVKQIYNLVEQPLSYIVHYNSSFRADGIIGEFIARCRTATVFNVFLIFAFTILSCSYLSVEMCDL